MKKIIIKQTEIGLIADISEIKPKFNEKETNNIIACFDVTNVFLVC